MNLVIRPVTPDDNVALKQLVLDTLTEFGCIGPGYASSDPELDDLHAAYQLLQSAFFVIEDADSADVLGSGVFSR